MKAIILWCRERIKLKELERDIQDIWESHSASLDAVQFNRDREDELLSYIHAELSHLRYEQDQILTSRRLRAASSYGIPIPLISDGSKYWTTHNGYRGHYLTTKGHAYLRREIAFEKDLARQPVITVIALMVSLLSLGISACSLYTSSHTVSETEQTKAPR